MNPLDLTIDQFQRIISVQQIPQTPAELKVAVVAIALNETTDKVKQMPMSRVNDIYRPIAHFKLPELRFKETLRIGKDYYRMSLYADTIKTGQLLELFSYETADEARVIQDLHKILATLARRCRLYKWFPEKYNGATHAERAELFRTKATLRDAWSVVGFFLLLSQPLLSVMSSSLQTKTKTAGKG
jgi:hypothetical protein